MTNFRIQAERKPEREAPPAFSPETLHQNETQTGQNLAQSLENAGAGQTLDESAREYLEPKFGHDFANIKIHADGQADQLTKSVGARAFATGQNVFFRQGEYQPHTSAGRHLLAHELTHTIQQSRGTVSGAPIADGVSVSDPNDVFEQEASEVADTVSQGGSVQVGGTGKTGVLQRSLDKRFDTGQIVLQRDPTPPTAPSVGTGTKTTFETPPLKIPHEATALTPIPLKMQAEVKGELSYDTPTPDAQGGNTSAPTQARVGGTASPTGGVGIQGEVQREFTRRTEGALAGWKPSLKGGGKITSHGGEIALEGGIERDWLAGTVVSQSIKFTILGIDLKENDITFIGMSYSLGLAKKILAIVPGTDAEFKGSIEFKFTPDWVQIGKWIAEKVAISAGETALAVDGAAVAASAAAIIAPAGAAALMIAGFIQTGKNIDASRAASGVAVRMRKQAKDYAKAYARTITGGSGTGPGADAAEEKIKTYRIISLKDRTEACNDLKEKNGGYQKIYTDILSALRPQLFAKAVSEFETNYQAEFGMLESLGEDWGMRGVFRRDMRMILFADDD